MQGITCFIVYHRLFLYGHISLYAKRTSIKKEDVKKKNNNKMTDTKMKEQHSKNSQIEIMPDITLCSECKQPCLTHSRVYKMQITSVMRHKTFPYKSAGNMKDVCHPVTILVAYERK